MPPRNLHDLRVWNEGLALVDRVYEASTGWPTDERFGMTAQIRRAAVSVPTNIAEGDGRGSPANRLHFSNIALGSAHEVYTLVHAARRRGFLTLDQAQSLAKEVDSYLVRLRNFVEALEKTATVSHRSPPR
ncbi:MAG: four helix bundle protein [Methanobacteriota archaeon]